MSTVVIKRPGDVQATKRFPGGTISERLILPGPDGCSIKASVFRPCSGFSVADGIVYDCDETCHILDGEITLHLTDERGDIRLRAGDIWHVRAGTVYGLTATTDAMVLVIWSPGADGTLPDDD